MLLCVCWCLNLCSEEKCKRCKQYAAEVGLPVLSNVLLPKTRGFCACLEVLRNSLDAGYFIQYACFICFLAMILSNHDIPSLLFSLTMYDTEIFFPCVW